MTATTTANMKALAAAFGTNRKLESEGSWVEYGPDIKVCVRRTTDPVYKLALRKAFKRFKHMGSALTPEQEELIKDQAAANGLIVDWKIEGMGPFTPETALEAFKAQPDFRRWCEEQGDDRDNFKGDADADLGNS